MSEAIADPRYWTRRIREAPRDAFHHAIFKCPTDTWRRIEDKHRAILARTILSRDSILDAGCGWGRLLTLLPSWWCGSYVGVDVAPDFISMAEMEYPKRRFLCRDLRFLGESPLWEQKFDWAVLISIRPMVKRHLGADAWEKMESELRRVANRLLFLEYDENDEGSVE